jgi:hypothetical protein
MTNTAHFAPLVTRTRLDILGSLVFELAPSHLHSTPNSHNPTLLPGFFGGHIDNSIFGGDVGRFSQS